MSEFTGTIGRFGAMQIKFAVPKNKMVILSNLIDFIRKAKHDDITTNLIKHTCIRSPPHTTRMLVFVRHNSTDIVIGG